jgi:hypothetical protein
MKKLALFFLLACTPEQRAEAIGLAGKEAGCVLQSIVEGGLDDPKALIDKCGKVTVQNIADITGGWLDQVTSTDSGKAAAVSPVQIRIALAHDRALAAIDGGSR